MQLYNITVIISILQCLTEWKQLSWFRHKWFCNGLHRITWCC